GIDAIIIARHGETIYQHYANGMTPETLHDSRSSFKSVTALLAGIALDKGYIKTLDEKVYTLFPQYKTFGNMDRDKAAMTIRDLLEMKSGFDCEEWEGTKDCEEAMAASDDWLKFSLDLPMAHKPGTHWSYTSSNTMIIGGVIERVANMSVIQFADSFFFRPLGITDYRWTRDPAHHGMTGGSFYILPTDMLKIGQLILNQGTWRGKRIVSEGWIAEATEPITEIEGFSNVGISNTIGAIPQPTYYGYQWYNERVVSAAFSYNVVFASGNGGQYIMVIPELDTVVV
ncbi:serine hydrolase domain-containing protein, partial [Parapedobacter sp. DT-150]|uniref:serine hydrolase domain-containing protein n=1 Tax=Parapedobacter sp. DT-150 TaxID=3396162 RepID=UPI003F19DF1D